VGKWFRRAWQFVYGLVGIDANQTTLTADGFTFTADGSTTRTFTLTTKNASGSAVSGVSWSATVERVSLDAAAGSVGANPSTIANDGVESSTITVIVVDDDGYNAPNVTVTLSATGTGNTVTNPASRTNASGVTTGSIVSTVAATKVVSALTAGQTITDTASVVVSAAPGLITPLFASDWRTATGSGASALLDTSGITAPLVWTSEGGANVVVANSGLGFPAGPTNVLDVPGDTGGIIRVTGLGAQSTGDVRYYRLYSRVDLPYPTSDNLTHPFQDGNAGSDSNWAIDYINNTALNFADCDATYYRIAVNFPEAQSVWYRSFYYGPLLERGTVYLLEWSVQYATSSTFNLSIRVSDSTGSLLYDDGDFYDARGAAAGRDLATANAGGTFVARSGHGISESDGLNVGTNDVYAEFAPTYGYQAAVAIADNQGWIGAYGSVDGE
jgi:hypothetical protein